MPGTAPGVEVCHVGDPGADAGLGGDHPGVLPALVVAVPGEGAADRIFRYIIGKWPI